VTLRTTTGQWCHPEQPCLSSWRGFASPQSAQTSLFTYLICLQHCDTVKTTVHTEMQFLNTSNSSQHHNSTTDWMCLGRQTCWILRIRDSVRHFHTNTHTSVSAADSNRQTDRQTDRQTYHWWHHYASQAGQQQCSVETGMPVYHTHTHTHRPHTV